MNANNLKNFLWQGRGLWSTTPVIAFTVILIRFAGLLQGWEWGVFDQYVRWRPPEARDNRIVIVGIDEQDLDNLKQATITDRRISSNDSSSKLNFLASFFNFQHNTQPK